MSDELCYHNIELADNTTKNVFYNGFGIKLIELLNFNNSEDNLKTKLEKWIYLFKHLHSLNSMPAAFDNPIFKRVFNLAELANLTKEEHMKYDSGLKAYWDHQHALAYATQHGIEKGKLEGKLEGKIETVHKLKEIGLPSSQISEVTGLSIAEIEKECDQAKH